MTLDGDLNRPATPSEEDLITVAVEQIHIPPEEVEEEEEVDLDEENPPQAIPAAVDDQPLFPVNDIPDFTPSIAEIQQSLNSIQEEINQLTARPTGNFATSDAENQDPTLNQQEEDIDEDIGEGLYKAFVGIYF